MDAFDADVLIYAASPGHERGRRVRALFPIDDDGAPVGIGSVLLLPELLTKPMRDGSRHEVESLTSLLSRLDLRPTDQFTAELAVTLGATYGVRAVDAVHLATAIAAGADRFITNNTDDFDPSIAGIAVTNPANLPDSPRDT